MKAEEVVVAADSFPRALLVYTLHMINNVAAVKLRLHNLEIIVLVLIELRHELLSMSCGLKLDLVEVSTSALEFFIAFTSSVACTA